MVVLSSSFSFNFNGDGWMRQSGCLGDAPLLAPSDPRDRQITRGSRVYKKNIRLVKLKPIKPRNGKIIFPV